ncbi:MAG TPA: hypothetical protein VGQ81_13485, partial [Acidobacteriota bacterium]|nr:hypothetical protein [Acidobacteriota bacterium]
MNLAVGPDSAGYELSDVSHGKRENGPAETVITADTRLRVLQYLCDIWNYRDLFRAFVERDVKVR